MKKIIFERLYNFSTTNLKIKEIINKMKESYMINSVYTLSAEGDLAITPVEHELKHTPNGLHGAYTLVYTIPKELKIITWGEYEDLQTWDIEARKLFYEIYEGGFEL